MFTGIIEELGRVKAIDRRSGNTSVTVEARVVLENARIGDSITISGTCLTITDMKKSSLSFDISPETLKNTNLGDLVVGSGVNLERSMRLSDRIGGHIVTGHVDGVGIIREKKPLGDSIFFRIEAPKSILRYVILKGSIAVDGISLTVVDVNDMDFGIVIIPHTASVTTLGFKGAGDRVNLEADILGKYIEKMLLSRGKREITMDFLKEYGFIGEIK